MALSPTANETSQALEAIRCARSARHQSECVLPMAVDLAVASRRLREENHFRELIEDSMQRVIDLRD